MNEFESKGGSLIAAVIVNQSFRQMLLSNPANALTGYGNQKFGFTRTERERILSIHATTLEEFADQVQQLILKNENRQQNSL